jgi:predicted naringenin-chalcone synthase
MSRDAPISNTLDLENHLTFMPKGAIKRRRSMSFFISGLGTAVPRELITQDDAARLAVELAGASCSHGPAMQTLYRKTGVSKRHSTLITSSTNGQPATQSFFPVAANSDDRGPTTETRMRYYQSAALDLATRAARAAMNDSGISAAKISHLVTVSCTGFHAPGIDIGLVERLSLDRGVSRTHIGFMGCHGALNGLRVASALSHTCPESKVLLCCVELCSIHHQYAAGPQQIVANALFSDGAAAVVGCSSESPEKRGRLVDQFSCLLLHTNDLMSWRIGNHGFEMCLSPQVPAVIHETLRPWLCERLDRHSLAINDVKSWAIHPGGPRILSACADSLGLDHACLEPSQRVLADYGNMSSPTVLFILEKLRAQGDYLPSVVLAFGPGLTIEGALIA